MSDAKHAAWNPDPHRQATWRSALAVLAWLAAGCAKPAPPEAPILPAHTAPIATPPLDTSCGALGCQLHDSAQDAMRAVLADRPLIIAIGEAHAQQGSEAIDSSAKRFTAQMLPLFQGLASNLVVEILSPPEGCEGKTKVVRKRQEPIVARQAESNQSEYLAMGSAAQAIGIAPELLRPTCRDFDRIVKARKDQVVDTMIETITQVSVTQVKGLLAASGRDPEKIILLYGGAFHGDPAPPPHRAAWSFAADLAQAVKGRYVSLHLFVPEAIGDDDDTWKRFAWYEHYDKRAHPDKVTLFHPRPDAYVLIFPATKKP